VDGLLVCEMQLGQWGRHPCLPHYQVIELRAG